MFEKKKAKKFKSPEPAKVITPKVAAVPADLKANRIASHVHKPKLVGGRASIGPKKSAPAAPAKEAVEAPQDGDSGDGVLQ